MAVDARSQSELTFVLLPAPPSCVVIAMLWCLFRELSCFNARRKSLLCLSELYQIMEDRSNFFTGLRR
jgi:hypothetical protein